MGIRIEVMSVNRENGGDSGFKAQNKMFLFPEGGHTGVT